MASGVKIGTINLKKVSYQTGISLPRQIDKLIVSGQLLDSINQLVINQGSVISDAIYHEIEAWALDAASKYARLVKDMVEREIVVRQIQQNALDSLTNAVEDVRLRNVINYKKNILKMQSLNEANLQKYGQPVTGQDKPPVGAFFFSTNNDKLAAQINQFMGPRNMIERTFNAAAEQFVPLIKKSLIDIVVRAAAHQNPRAFPPEYVPPMIACIMRMDIQTFGREATIRVLIPPLQEVFGDIDTLEGAYHHGAVLSNIKKGTRGFLGAPQRANILEGRVFKAQLRQQDDWVRYRFWRDYVSRGATIGTLQGFNPKFYKDAKGRVRGPDGKFYKKYAPATTEQYQVQIPAHAWADTIDARLFVWGKNGGFAPQFWLLEYGQYKWAPYVSAPGASKSSTSDDRNLGINPQSITGKWIRGLAAEWEKIIKAVWTKQIKQFNATKTPAGLARNSQGELVPVVTVSRGAGIGTEGPTSAGPSVPDNSSFITYDEGGNIIQGPQEGSSANLYPRGIDELFSIWDLPDQLIKAWDV